MISKDNKRFPLTIDKNLYAKLKLKADSSNRSVNNYILNLIKNDLEVVKMFKEVGNLWNDVEKIIISDGSKFYVLNSWNGEVYGDCWEVKDSKGLDRVNDKSYTIKPIYKEVEEDEFEIVDYIVE